jgi:outer membrane lipoprotein-sorting protein
MKVRSSLVVLVLALIAPSLWADARTDQWVAKARSALGAESALNQVNSIHFKGTLATTQKVPVNGDTSNLKDKAIVLAIDIVFQKPYQQRMELRSDSVIETTALDGYDAWLRRADAKDEKKWQLTLLDAQQVKRLRANTWENLFFYAGIEKRGGKVEFAGDASIDGHECAKLVFSHADNIVFTRYFEKATGRLVKTETENGGEIREEGEFTVQGLRFPRKLLNRAPGGQVATITFESVTINEPFPADFFAVPTLLPPR